MSRLSTNFNFFYYLILIVVLIIFAGWINSIRLNVIGIKKDGLWELPVFVLIGYLILYLIKKMKTVDFDTNNLYIKSRKSNLTIPLEKITKIKIIMIEVGDASFYKIEFKTSTEKLESVRILPNNLFPQFLEIVKQKNRNLKIKKWSHSFDFDI